ncbi:MAG TPA: hypothetical protein DCL62_06910 [Kandleria vitulina]|jgi:uncharacterized protein YktA (UPF0223 family)|nr:hypothetical protein [Kandleria vitulina]
MYDYPLLEEWTTQEICDVIALYNAVEKAYEGGIKRDQFVKAYRRFTEIVDSKSLQKQLDRAFMKASSYSIYKVFKASQEGNDMICL